MKIIQTPNAPAAIGPYVQGKIVNGFLFASGQIPLDPQTGEIVGTTIQEQAAQVFKNIHGILEAAGIAEKDVVKTTCFLKNMEDFVPFNEVYGKAFSAGDFPARSAIEVARLPKDALVEVEVIAAVPQR
ncbi:MULTISPECIES: RidA family protein [Enterococcus]|uniref:RidA family protein n=1 Tax=Enterococcus TaxID=1350 RepID=UPI00065E00DE|nr:MULTISPECIES: RidA family protein [Enterococcus]KAF1301186.1 regulator [Enterococcus sp. JM9B]